MDDQRVRQVVEGVALGVLAQDVRALASGKTVLELNFTRAWRRWSRADQFPNMGAGDPGNLFWIGMGKSPRRKMASAAWRTGRWAEPYLLRPYADWSIYECLSLFADERASSGDWVELGRLYVAQFNPDEIQRQS